VLIGSTEKMGVGTNVQDRAIALQHLDAPWRPADVAQREGRIIRQGNLNPEVQIYRYVTQRSFDGYMWQNLQRKAAFIGQVMHNRLDAREISDIGDTALSFFLIWTGGVCRCPNSCDAVVTACHRLWVHRVCCAGLRADGDGGGPGGLCGGTG
jgi:hypothetical protein